MSKQIIICAGFGQSGNSCVRDFLKEFDNVFVDNNEDWLIKYSLGLLDLRNTILYNNNYYTADGAIKGYLKTVLYYSKKKEFQDLYKNKLLDITYDFINKIIEGCYSVKWKPFNWHYEIFNNNEPIINKVFVAKKLKEKELDKIIKNYLNNLYEIITDKPYIVLINSIQNGNLKESLKIFNNAKVITCARNLQDVYLDFKLNTKGTFIPIDSYENICLFFDSVYYEYPVIQDNILNIKFEDFIQDYEKTSKKIMNFTGLKSQNHIHKQKFFNPDFSKRNIEIWKKYQNDPIVLQLKQYSDNLFSHNKNTINHKECKKDWSIEDLEGNNTKIHPKKLKHKLYYMLWSFLDVKLRKKGMI